MNEKVKFLPESEHYIFTTGCRNCEKVGECDFLAGIEDFRYRWLDLGRCGCRTYRGKRIAQSGIITFTMDTKTQTWAFSSEVKGTWVEIPREGRYAEEMGKVDYVVRGFRRDKKTKYTLKSRVLVTTIARIIRKLDGMEE